MTLAANTGVCAGDLANERAIRDPAVPSARGQHATLTVRDATDWRTGAQAGE